jgi:hypothetical protein
VPGYDDALLASKCINKLSVTILGDGGAPDATFILPKENTLENDDNILTE